MDPFLVWIFLVGLLAIGAADYMRERTPPILWSRFCLALALGVVGAALLIIGFTRSPYGPLRGTFVGLGLGLVLGGLPPLAAIGTRAFSATGFANAGFAMALLHWGLPDAWRAASLPLLAAYLGALCLHAALGQAMAIAASWGAGLIAVLSGDVVSSLSNAVAHQGLLGERLAVLAMVILLVRMLPTYSWRYSGAAAAALALLAGAAIIQTPHVVPVGVASVGLSLLVIWLLPDESENRLTYLLATAVWVALGTYAFAIGQSSGIALALFAGLVPILAMGSARSLASMLPLLLLALFRAFRTEHVDAVRAIDIGQHYVLIGLLVGMMLALAPGEFRRIQLRSETMLWSSLAAGLGISALVVSAMVVLGAKGSVGLFVGLFVGAIGASAFGLAVLWPMVSAMSMAAFIGAAYPYVAPLFDVDRSQKVTFIMWGVAIAIAGSGAALYMARARAPETAA